MILIDTNALIILIMGRINPKLINTHRRTSIYDQEDYYNLIEFVKDISKIITLPNILTEVDNLLNSDLGKYHYQYIKVFLEFLKQSNEKYFETKKIIESQHFLNLGLTDSAIIEVAKDCDYLITADSKLSDFAKANSINVIDLVEIKNIKLQF